MSDVLTRSRLKKFPKPVADVLMDEVARHPGLSVRFLDATHLRIYDGGQGHPFQVAASRPAEDALRKLRPWLDKRTTHKEEETQMTEAPEAITVEDMVVDAAREGIELIDAGNGFTTDGTLYVCATCGWSKEGKRGLHLHALGHSDPSIRKEMARKAANNRKTNTEQRKATTTEAIETLAEAIGITLITQSAYDEVVAERDEARAKLALYDETLKTLRGL